MRFAPLLLFAAAALAAAPAVAAVEVYFVEPQGFTDAASHPGARPRPDSGPLRELAQHLRKRGAGRLAEGQTLRIEVLDVDLAGWFEPWRAIAYNARILRESAWPRLALRYVLEQDGREIARGEEKLSDLQYLDRPRGRLASDPLRYEKLMLDDWLRRRFPAAG